MEMSFFWKGLLFGLLVTIPIGPTGILCIQRTLQCGRISGWISGLGVVVADLIYAGVAAFGLTFVSNFVVAAHFWLRLLGGAILLYLGIKTFIAKVNEVMTAPHTTLFNDFISTFFLMMTNPMTIVGFIVLFASFGLSKIEENFWNSSALVLGVGCGSVIGWGLVCEIVALFRDKMTSQVMRWVNRIAGVLIIGFGLAAWVYRS
jgi:threonine/homoserine/homoserine lactone efflux protein